MRAHALTAAWVLLFALGGSMVVSCAGQHRVETFADSLAVVSLGAREVVREARFQLDRGRITPDQAEAVANAVDGVYDQIEVAALAWEARRTDDALEALRAARALLNSIEGSLD